jgi:hypothetical protein
MDQDSLSFPRTLPPLLTYAAAKAVMQARAVCLRAQQAADRARISSEPYLAASRARLTSSQRSLEESDRILLQRARRPTPTREETVELLEPAWEMAD